MSNSLQKTSAALLSLVFVHAAKAQTISEPVQSPVAAVSVIANADGTEDSCAVLSTGKDSSEIAMLDNKLGRPVVYVKRSSAESALMTEGAVALQTPQGLRVVDDSGNILTEPQETAAVSEFIARAQKVCSTAVVYPKARPQDIRDVEVMIGLTYGLAKDLAGDIQPLPPVKAAPSTPSTPQGLTPPKP